MKNDYHIGDTKISIPPSVLFSAIGIVPDVRQAVTADFKRGGDVIYVLGITRDETGGSEFFASLGHVGNKVPRVREPDQAIAMYRAVHRAITHGLIASCHDLSDGGMAVAIAESCFSGALGATVHAGNMIMDGVTRNDTALFSESPCRLLISVSHRHTEEFESLMASFPLARVGLVEEHSVLTIRGIGGKVTVQEETLALKRAWQMPLGV
jgi:phosphoribosylformylglycinamidine synthase